jgi:hypothetical protein
MYTMNRCHHRLDSISPVPRRGLLKTAALSLAGMALGAGTAWAQVREFPRTALRGVIQVTAPPQILIDGNVDRLSPGARIRGPQNNLVMSGALVGQRLVVNYTREQSGLVHEVWILTEAEADKKLARAVPERNFVFESDAAKPAVDDGKTPFYKLPKYGDPQ